MKDVKGAFPANAQVTRKRSSLISDTEKVSGLDRRADRPQHSLEPKSDPEQALKTLFNFLKAERGEEAAREKLEAAGLGVEESSRLRNVKVKAKQPVLM